MANLQDISLLLMPAPDRRFSIANPWYDRVMYGQRHECLLIVREPDEHWRSTMDALEAGFDYITKWHAR